jgi:uncharacterized membrane protein YfcA
MDSYKIATTVILGIVVGILGGWQGQAGALYILTGLMVFNIVKNQHVAAGTALLYTSVPISLGATYQYYKNDSIDWEAAMILIPIVFIFSILGAKINFIVHEKITILSIAFTTLLITIYYFYKAHMIKW